VSFVTDSLLWHQVGLGRYIYSFDVTTRIQVSCFFVCPRNSPLHITQLPTDSGRGETVSRFVNNFQRIYTMVIYSRTTNRIRTATIHSRASLGGRIVASSDRPVSPKPKLSYDPKSDTWGTVTYTKNHGKQMASSFGRKSLICFYCNKRSSIKYDGFITQWECGKCDAMNYLDAVSYTLPSLHRRRPTNTSSTARKYHRSSSSYDFCRCASTS